MSLPCQLLSWPYCMLQDAKAKAKAEKAEKARKKEQERLALAKAKEEGGGGDSKKAQLKKAAEAKKVVIQHQYISTNTCSQVDSASWLNRTPEN